jgi:hypothetical protein
MEVAWDGPEYADEYYRDTGTGQSRASRTSSVSVENLRWNALQQR